ncbi:MAG: RICIN domain-containing protein [Prevotella sp.]|jgi:hypothetical protein|nr:RICIN domain-containing protein [Prevotella sp.]
METIKDGLYTIGIKGKVLDVEKAQKSNGTKIIAYSSNSKDNQKWLITSVGNGKYRVISLDSLMAMEIGTGIVGRNDLQIWDFESKENQLWKIQQKDGGYYFINSNSNKYLTLDSDSTKFYESKDNKNTSQTFTLNLLNKACIAEWSDTTVGMSCIDSLYLDASNVWTTCDIIVSSTEDKTGVQISLIADGMLEDSPKQWQVLGKDEVKKYSFSISKKVTLIVGGYISNNSISTSGFSGGATIKLIAYYK